MQELFQINKPSEFLPIIEKIFHSAPQNRALIISLSGDLGAGKTTFTQELSKFLGVDEQVVSPTFTIMKKYSLNSGDYEELVHIDAYRIESEEEVDPLHLDALFGNPKNIICIEWPEQIPSVIPQDTVKVSIKITEEETREVSLNITDPE